VAGRNGDSNLVTLEILPVLGVNGLLRVLLFREINEPETSVRILFPRKADVRNFPVG
jgi:hypothetical protein